MISRRRFVGETVILSLVPLAVACSSDEDDDGKKAGSCDGLGASSSVDDGHYHTVCVAAADLMNPPAAGATYTTSNDSGHTHEITLSADQLMQIAGGGSVTVTTTVAQVHTHTFMLQEAN